jgi:hypothetical protein
MPTGSADRTWPIKLSTKGLENTAFLGITDFAIKIAGKRFECSRFDPAFISTRMTQLLSEDPSIDGYEMDVEPDQEIDFATMESILAPIPRKGLFEISESNFEFAKVGARNLS